MREILPRGIRGDLVLLPAAAYQAAGPAESCINRVHRVKASLRDRTVTS